MKETNDSRVNTQSVKNMFYHQDQLTIENANKVGETRNVAAVQCRSSCLVAQLQCLVAYLIFVASISSGASVKKITERIFFAN